MKTAKRLVCIGLLLLLVIGIAAGCGTNGEAAKRTKATVIRVIPEAGTLLIELDEDTPYGRGGAQATIPVDDPGKFETGDRISFHIGDDIYEMSPLWIKSPEDIRKIPW